MSFIFPILCGYWTRGLKPVKNGRPIVEVTPDLDCQQFNFRTECKRVIISFLLFSWAIAWCGGHKSLRPSVQTLLVGGRHPAPSWAQGLLRRRRFFSSPATGQRFLHFARATTQLASCAEPICTLCRWQQMCTCLFGNVADSSFPQSSHLLRCFQTVATEKCNAGTIHSPKNIFSKI